MFHRDIYDTRHRSGWTCRRDSVLSIFPAKKSCSGTLPQSALGKAVGYTLNMWTKLERCNVERLDEIWYQERWGERYQLSDDQNQKSRFENTRTGYRVVVPMSAGTGERGDYVIVDDPHSVDQAESDTERRSAIEWWNGAMSTRLNDFATGHRIVIMQRLHEADLTGDWLSKGGCELLCLPAEFEPERRCQTSIGWSDPRQQPGELLWPAKVRQADLERLKVELGSYRYAAQT